MRITQRQSHTCILSTMSAHHKSVPRSRSITTFILPRGVPVLTGFLSFIGVGVLFIGIIDLADSNSLGGLAFAFIIIGALLSLSICTQTGNHVLIFDDSAQLIWLENRRCCTGTDGTETNTKLGSYHSFEKCIVHEIVTQNVHNNATTKFEIRFLFHDGSHYPFNKGGNESEIRQRVRQINTFWKRKSAEFPKQNVQPPAAQEVQMAIDVIPSAPFEVAPSGTGMSEGNIMGNVEVKRETEKVRLWMATTVKLPEYTEILIANGFDSLAMFENEALDKESLDEMGITKVGHRKRILAEARKLQQLDRAVIDPSEPLVIAGADASDPPAVFADVALEDDDGNEPEVQEEGV